MIGSVRADPAYWDRAEFPERNRARSNTAEVWPGQVRLSLQSSSTSWRVTSIRDT